MWITSGSYDEDNLNQIPSIVVELNSSHLFYNDYKKNTYKILMLFIVDVAMLDFRVYELIV